MRTERVKEILSWYGSDNPGTLTNLARLLDSRGDDASPLTGRELAAQKVRLVSMMAGEFRPGKGNEYNIWNDIPAAQKVFVENGYRPVVASVLQQPGLATWRGRFSTAGS